jgi:hypothetical protein
VHRPLRLGLVVLGISAVVYGMASLTGGWLGTPPWWERAIRDDEIENYKGPPGILTPTMPGQRFHKMERWELVTSREGREWISGGVVAVGLCPIAFGAWARRRLAAAP